MGKKSKEKSLEISKILICIAIVVIIIIGIFFIVKGGNSSNKKSADKITISESDSKETKKEKLEKKIELINKDIDEIQNQIKPELEKLNNMYEEYAKITNDSQPGTPATEEDMKQAEENMRDYLENEKNQ